MNPHLPAALGALLWTAICAVIDRLSSRTLIADANEDGAAIEEPGPLPLAVIALTGLLCAAIALATPDPLEGAAAALAVATLVVAAARDARDHILWPELFQIALPLELLLRAYDGRAYDAAMGFALFGALAWGVVFTLQVIRLPQGGGDILPAMLIGASYPIHAGVTGVSIGFIAYTIFVLLTRTATREMRIVPMGPAFAMTAVTATLLTSILHYD